MINTINAIDRDKIVKALNLLYQCVYDNIIEEEALAEAELSSHELSRLIGELE